jgi:hypothetical protein
MFSIFLKIVARLKKYGKRAVDWCWRNRQRIYNWIRDGLAIEAIVRIIEDILGL